MGLRDRIQLAQARSAYNRDPQARAALDQLNSDAEQDPSITRAEHLRRERQIIAQHRQNRA